jgi:DNA-binding response OmpR family regulator
MKPPIVLLFSCDPLAQGGVQDAVLSTRHGLRVIQTTREAIHVLQGDCSDVDVAIIDLDPGMHGTALLEAAAARLPVIALTSLEEMDMTPIAQRHGAVACVAKPFAPGALAAAIRRVERHPVVADNSN